MTVRKPDPDPETWRAIAARTQAYRDSTIDQVNPPVPIPSTPLPLDVSQIPTALLPQAELDITHDSTANLLRRLAAGALSATAVAAAFLRAAGLAHRLTNCVTELLTARALARAQQLDEYFAVHGKPVGPLHGLPISVKEHVSMQGLDLNAGWCSWVGKMVPKEDALILKILEKAGAVFIARTTEPQTVMHLETSSNLYGVTVNPYNRKLTSGGSSGGEGALIALHGSCLGIGSDIGGSIRSPAANVGIYGLRPTSYRLPVKGCSETMIGMEQVVCVLGPMSESLDGINRFMRTILDSKPWLSDPAVVPIPWREHENLLVRDGSHTRRLKIGIMWDDGVVRPHPPVLRALREVVDRLKGVEGIEFVDWKPYKHDWAWEIIARLFFPDGGQEEKDAIAASGEPWRPLSKFIVLDNPFVTHMDISEVWSWTRNRDEYRQEYAEVWNNTATGFNQAGEPEGMVDVILCPVGPGAAPPLDCSRYWGYTSQWNILDYPALVFPVTTVDVNVDSKDYSYRPRNERDKYNFELYDPETYRNAPVSLQLVGRRYEDEKVVQALEMIEEYLQHPKGRTRT